MLSLCFDLTFFRGIYNCIASRDVIPRRDALLCSNRSPYFVRIPALFCVAAAWSYTRETRPRYILVLFVESKFRVQISIGSAYKNIGRIM